MKPRVSRGQAASRLASTPPARLSPQDEHIFRELMERFAVLSEMCFRFSQDIYLRTGAVPELDVEETVRRNLSIARRVFGDRFLEILGGLTTPDISRKLRVLEMAGLVESGPSFGEPDQTRFSLTHKGVVIARLGEPVFLYLRLAEGWNAPTSPVRPAAQAEAAEKAADVHAEART